MNHAQNSFLSDPHVNSRAKDQRFCVNLMTVLCCLTITTSLQAGRRVLYFLQIRIIRFVVLHLPHLVSETIRPPFQQI